MMLMAGSIEGRMPFFKADTELAGTIARSPTNF